MAIKQTEPVTYPVSEETHVSHLNKAKELLDSMDGDMPYFIYGTLDEYLGGYINYEIALQRIQEFHEND